MAETIHANVSDIFDEKIIAMFRVISGIRRLTRKERAYLNREIELTLQNPNKNPNNINDEKLDNLEDCYQQFDSYYKVLEAFTNLITKMWKEEDAGEILVSSEPLKVKLIKPYAKGLYRYDYKEHRSTGHYFIERKNWVPLIWKCSAAIQNEWAAFYKKYWGYKEWLKTS